MGQLVEVLHVRVGRRVVEVEVAFFDGLAVVALRVRKAKETFLEVAAVGRTSAREEWVKEGGRDLLLLVPKGKGNVHAAVGVRDTSNAVLAPAKGAAACHVVGEVGPGIAVGTEQRQSASCPRTRIDMVALTSSPRGLWPIVARPRMDPISSSTVSAHGLPSNAALPH